MELWMYLFLAGMFLVAVIATVWMTLWTIQRGEARRKAEQAGEAPARPARQVRTISTKPADERGETSSQ